MADERAARPSRYDLQNSEFQRLREQALDAFESEETVAAAAADALSIAKAQLLDLMEWTGREWRGSALLALAAAIDDLDRGRDHWLIQRRKGAHGRDNLARQHAKRALAQAYWLLVSTGTKPSDALRLTLDVAKRAGVTFKKGRNQGTVVKTATLRRWIAEFAPDSDGSGTQRSIAKKLVSFLVLREENRLSDSEIEQVHRELVGRAADPAF